MYEGELRSLYRLDSDRHATINTIVDVSEPNIDNRSRLFGWSSVEWPETKRILNDAYLCRNGFFLVAKIKFYLLRPACRRNGTARTGRQFIVKLIEKDRQPL